MPERAVEQWRAGPGVVQPQHQRRQDLAAHVARAHATAGIAEAIEDIALGAHAAEERQTGDRAIRRAVPGGCDIDAGECREELFQRIAQQVRIG